LAPLACVTAVGKRLKHEGHEYHEEDRPKQIHFVRFVSFVFKIRQMFRPADKPAWSRYGY